MAWRHGMTNSNKLADALREMLETYEYPWSQNRPSWLTAVNQYLAEHDAQPAPAPVQVYGWCPKCGCGGSGYAHLAGCVNLRPPAPAADGAVELPLYDDRFWQDGISGDANIVTFNGE